MKKQIIIALIAPLLIGCKQNIIDKNAINCVMQCQQYGLKEINSSEINSLLTNKTSFPLLLYSDLCSICNNAKEILKDFTKSNNYLIYSFNIENKSGFSNLIKNNPNIFSNINNVPTLYLFKDGELSYSFDSKIFENSSTYFENIAKNYFISTNVFSFSKIEDLDFISNKENRCFIILYYNNDNVFYDFYKCCFNIAKDYKFPTLLVNIEKTIDSDIEILKNNFNLLEFEQKEIVYYNSIDDSVKYYIDFEMSEITKLIYS